MLISDDQEKPEDEQALEVENVLLKRLQEAIDRNVPYSDRFEKSKKLLQQQINTPMDPEAKKKFRRRVYRLNNLLAESDSIFDHINVSLCCSLNQIVDEIEYDIKDVSSTLIPEDPERKPLTAIKETARAPSTPIPPLEPRGLETDEMAVENLLLHRSGSEEFNAVGIVGAEGVGKTTLAQVIFRNKKVRSRFLPRIWISLAEHPDDSKENSAEIAVAKRILLALGFDLDTINEMKPSDDGKGSSSAAVAPATTDKQPKKSGSLLATVRKTARVISRSFTGSKKEEEVSAAVEEEAVEPTFLDSLIHAIRLELTRKRYLIVLDGASKTNKWYGDLREVLSPESKMEEKLAFAFPKGSGGAVLVTGRVESVVRDMVGRDGKGIHRLLPLDKPEVCWEIYMEAAGEKEEKMEPEEKEKVRDEVMKRCNGHPAAAVLMGEIRKKQLGEIRKCWEKYLEAAGEREQGMDEKKAKRQAEVWKKCHGDLSIAQSLGEKEKRTQQQKQRANNEGQTVQQVQTQAATSTAGEEADITATTGAIEQYQAVNADAQQLQAQAEIETATAAATAGGGVETTVTMEANIDDGAQEVQTPAVEEAEPTATTGAIEQYQAVNSDAQQVQEQEEIETATATAGGVETTVTMEANIDDDAQEVQTQIATTTIEGEMEPIATTEASSADAQGGQTQAATPTAGGETERIAATEASSADVQERQTQAATTGTGGEPEPTARTEGSSATQEVQTQATTTTG